LCGYAWNSREHFLSDPSIILEGYQANFNVLEEGLFIFCHTISNCRTSLALDVYSLDDLYTGPIFLEKKLGTGCPGYCLHQNSLQSCDNACECVFVRMILQIIRKWPKENRL
jgi:hypothetical protein